MDSSILGKHIIKLYLDEAPFSYDFDYYRGDNLNIVIIGFNEDETPFNWELLDGFKSQFKVNRLQNGSVVEFDSNDFFLGQTDEAIQYDIDEGNPAHTTFDELHILHLGNGSLFTNIRNYKKLEYDVQYELDDDIQTIIEGTMSIKLDTTITEEEGS